MSSINVNSPAARLQAATNDFQQAYTQVPSKVTGVAADMVRESGKYFVPAGEVAAGSWLAQNQAQDAINLAMGRDGTVFKASTSTTDAVVGTAVHGLMAAVGAGMAVHGALQIASNIAASIEKQGQ